MFNTLEKKMEYLSAQTESVLLFHSAGGKDSIMMLDLCAKYIKHVECVFMYTVDGLEHVDKYINWAIDRYKVKFYRVEHYATKSAIKAGHLGCTHDPTVKVKKLNDVVTQMKEYTGIEWAAYGFKRSDSMNRNLMMNKLEMQSFNLDTKNAYPICDLKNNQVLQYIEDNNLIRPISYGKGRSSGVAPSDKDFLNWCRENYPQDYAKIISYFPLAATIA